MGPSSGGSIDKVSPTGKGFDYLPSFLRHIEEDVLPFLFCCKGAKKLCQIYYDRRPSDDGTRYRPPIPG